MNDKQAKTPLASVFRRRLLKLAAFLEKLPPERFEFGTWVGASWKGAQDLSCGTTACALAWAATIPSFRAAGLYLRQTDHGPEVRLKGARPRLREHGAEDTAARILFGLDTFGYQRLFIPRLAVDGLAIGHYYGKPVLGQLGGNATARAVAENIRAYVKERSRG